MKLQVVQPDGVDEWGGWGKREVISNKGQGWRARMASSEYFEKPHADEFGLVLKGNG